MEMNVKFKRRMTAWIAGFAVLLAALAPSISQAIFASKVSAAGFGEICSVTGNKLAKVEHEGHHSSSSPAEKGLHFEHCPFCFTHAGSVGLPPATDLVLPMPVGTQLMPPLFYQSPRSLFTWAAAQSRAPPSLF